MDPELIAEIAQFVPESGTIVVVGGEGTPDLVRAFPGARVNIFYLGRHPIEHYCVDLEIPRVHYLHVGRFPEIIQGAESLLEFRLVDALWFSSPSRAASKMLARHGYTQHGRLFRRPS